MLAGNRTGQAPLLMLAATEWPWRVADPQDFVAVGAGGNHIRGQAAIDADPALYIGRILGRMSGEGM
jgi:hypothetical protein